jgi:hypothetical protein
MALRVPPHSSVSVATQKSNQAGWYRDSAVDLYAANTQFFYTNMVSVVLVVVFMKQFCEHSL